MVETAEVVVVGGGAIGLSVAYHLAEMGPRDVVVVEKEDILGAGSTGRCAGGVRQQFATEVNVRLGMESVKFFKRVSEELGTGEFKQYGYLFLCTADEHMEGFRQLTVMQRRLGLDVRLVTPAEILEIVPDLYAGDILGGAFCPTDGYADPHEIVQYLASGAARRGVKILTGTEVTGVELRGGRISGVRTSRGEISTPAVVNCAGPWARGVAAMAGVDLPVHPLRRQLQCTKPVPRPRDPLPMVIDMTDGTHFRRESGGLLIGRVNPAEPFGFNFAVDWDWLAGTVELAVKRVPVLADAEILRAWAGLYEVTPDNHPVLGAVPEVPGFYLANGFSGHGFMHSPSAGRAVAEIILRGRSETVDVSMLDLGRFARGEEIHGLELI